MDTRELEKKLQPLKERLDAENIFVKCLIIKESIEGFARAPFYVDVCIPSVTVENYDTILSRVYDIFGEITDDITRKSVFALCVVNECQNERHCRPVNEPEVETVALAFT